MKVSALTGLILQINKAIDSGRYNDISISDVHNAIDSHRLLRFIKEKCGEDVDLSIYLESRAYGDFEEFYEEKMNQIYSAYAGDERRKWGVENLGLCLILAWTNEIIQWGEGLQLS
jgi:hypothetical protein